MKIKTSHILWSSIAILALSQGENVRQSLAKGSQTRQEQASFSDRIRLNRSEARQAERLSKVALDRYKANCILVSDAKTGIPSYFQPGEPVIEPKLNRTIRSGAFVCNELGDTAVINELGTITDIARISTPDLPTFNKLLEQRR